MIRQRVDRVLKQEGHSATDDTEWEFAIDVRWVESTDINTLVVTIIEARKAFTSGQRVERTSPRQSQRGASQIRSHAISLLVAKDAAEANAVVSFRQKWLPALIAFKEIERWVQDRRTDPERPLTLLSFPNPAGIVRRAALAQSGPLRELAQVTRYLSNTYRWTEAEATTFVLTGIWPLIQPISSSLIRSEFAPLSRIQLAIDPAISPRQVEAAYRSLRAQVIGRYRNQTEKHIRLAIFSSEHSGVKLAEQMADWNRQYPKWGYKAISNFGRDTSAAKSRLLAPANIKIKALFGEI